jgi:Spy/CpxP family protein refolding chaperone
MNKRMTFLAGLSALMIAGTTFAGDRNARMERGHERGGPDLGLQVIEHLGKAIRRLDLTEDQKTSIRAEFMGFKETIRPLAKELHKGRMQLRDVISEGEYDADAAAEIAEQQGQITTDITLAVSDAVASVLAQLSDEQRAELEAMGEERRARKEQRREKIEARKRERMEARGQEPPEGT